MYFYNYCHNIMAIIVEVNSRPRRFVNGQSLGHVDSSDILQVILQTPKRTDGGESGRGAGDTKFLFIHSYVSYFTSVNRITAATLYGAVKTNQQNNNNNNNNRDDLYIVNWYG